MYDVRNALKELLLNRTNCGSCLLGSCGPGLDGVTSADTEPLIKDPRPKELSAVSHMDVQGYKWVCWKVWLCRIGALCSLGLLLVLFNWRPRLGILARCRSCPISMADVLLLKDRYGQQFVVDVLTEQIEEGSLEFAVGEADENEWRDTVQLHSEKKTQLRYYVFEGMRYIWISRKGAFCKASILTEGWTCAYLHNQQQGLSKADQSTRKQIFGANVIDVPVKSYLQLLFEEVLNPFYIFQVFSIILWMSDRYYYYAACILIISLISISVSLYEIRKQSTTLRRMARLIVNVTVRRDTGEEECVSSEELVPGDCIVIPAEGLLLPCDAALLAGECMVNESMLTGESIPVMKTSLSVSEATYRSESQPRHTLFCGTQLIQAKGGGPAGNGAIAVVTCTGFFTAKGDLISSILYPQPLDFRFFRDAMKFLLFLGLLVAIIRRFLFSSSLQRMSVVTVGPGGASPVAFIKGAPEMVASFCLRESVPSHFSPTLREYASQGFRVLGFAYKHLTKETNLSTVERVEVEKDMNFLGLLVMKNQVKPESAEVIRTLKLAQLRPVMVTGDNILTAVNVARACGMVLSHEKVIFVHASPPTASSVASLQFHQGDGAVATTDTQDTIDILAQNSAGYHLAINGMSFAALCDHFPEYLPKILMRGTVYARMTPEQKTQLVKALQKLKYYNREKTNLGDFQFLFFDLVLVTVLAIVMGRGGPSDELHPQRPPASLLSLPVLSSLLLHTVLLILAQVSALLITVSQDWYVPLNSTVTGAANLPNMEDTSIFTLTGFQYIMMSIVITKGYPYKKPLYYNCALLVFFALMCWLVLFRHTIIHQLLKLYEINDMSYKLLLIAVAALNFFICYLLENLIDRGALNCLHNLRGKRESKKQYKRLDAHLAGTPSWPPLNQPLFPTQCSVIGVS
ncbi:hypothetical protein cypCar_00005322 [Cyprinus carpio]|nr:hypothetical protein cypCar_00005322 [Cyprinus carpio]